MMKYIPLILASFLISYSSFFSCCPAQAEEEIKIGVVYSLSGLGQYWSGYGRIGLELARDEINNNGGVNGKKIRPYLKTFKLNPQK